MLDAYLFGSQARGTPRRGSDVDVAVYLDRDRVCDAPFGYVAELATELKLFRYKGPANGTLTVQEADLAALHDALLAPKYGFGAPTVNVARVHVDGKLELVHEHATDGRGLDPERGRKVLEYIARVWRRPVTLTTVDNDNRAVELAVNPSALTLAH